MELKECVNCKKMKMVSTKGKGYLLCRPCSKKLYWKPKIVECKRCKRLLSMHAHGLCNGCYSSVFNLESVRLSNAKRYHHISPELYQKVVKGCVVCGFNKIVDLHHLDHNKTNNSKENLAGLCPNHHKMLHTKAYQKEVFDTLREKGFNVPEIGYSDGFFKDSKRLG